MQVDARFLSPRWSGADSVRTALFHMLELLQRPSSPTRLWSEPISLPEPCTHLSARVDSPNRTASPSLALKLNRQAPSRWLSCLTRRNQSMHSFPCSLPRWSFSSWLWRSLRSSSSATRLRISPSFQQDSQIEVSWSSSCRHLLWKQNRWEK